MSVSREEDVPKELTCEERCRYWAGMTTVSGFEKNISKMERGILIYRDDVPVKRTVRVNRGKFCAVMRYTVQEGRYKIGSAMNVLNDEPEATEYGEPESFV